MNRRLVRWAWLLPMSSVLLALVLHHASGEATSAIVFISQADAAGLDGAVFTVGLSLSALLQMVVVHGMTQGRPGVFLERTSGLLAALCVLLMANLSMYDALNAHISAALGIFIAGGVWLAAVEVRATQNGCMSGSTQRRAAVALVAVGLVAMMLTVRLAVEADPTGPMVPTRDASHPWWTVAALAEYLLVAGLWWGIAAIGPDEALYAST
jgi:hypothetical protein